MKRRLEKPEREKAPNILYSGEQYLLIQEFDWLESHFPKYQNLKKCYEHLHHLRNMFVSITSVKSIHSFVYIWNIARMII